MCATRPAPSVRTRSGAASQAGTPSPCSPHRPPLLRTSAPGPGPQLPCTPCPPARPHRGPCPAGFRGPWVQPGPPPRSPRPRPLRAGQGPARGPSAGSGERGAGRRLRGSPCRGAFSFRVNATSLRAPLGPLIRPYSRGARPPGAATRRDSRVAGRAGLRGRRSAGAGLPGQRPAAATRGPGRGPRLPARGPARGRGEQGRGLGGAPGRGPGTRRRAGRCWQEGEKRLLWHLER